MLNNLNVLSIYKKIITKTELSIIFFVILISIIFSLLSPNFSQVQNIRLIALQISINGILAIGMAMIVLLGGINLSVGSTLALCATFSGILNNMGVPIPIIFILSITAGGLSGLFNAFLIVKLKIPDIIATLATMTVIRGIAVMISGGKWITNFTDDFSQIGQGSLLKLPYTFIVFIVLAIIFGIVLSEFNWGRKLYAIGGNKEAALLVGINEKQIRTTVYLIDGILIGLASVLYASMMANVQASTAGKDTPNLILAAVLIGGASIFGGKGTILGISFGVLLMGVIRNGMILIKASEYWIDAITGGLIILALVVNLLQKKVSER